MSNNTGISFGTLPLRTIITAGLPSLIGKTSRVRYNQNIDISKNYFIPRTVSELRQQVSEDGIPLPEALSWSNLLESRHEYANRNIFAQHEIHLKEQAMERTRKSLARKNFIKEITELNVELSVDKRKQAVKPILKGEKQHKTLEQELLHRHLFTNTKKKRKEKYGRSESVVITDAFEPPLVSELVNGSRGEKRKLSLDNRERKRRKASF